MNRILPAFYLVLFTSFSFAQTPVFFHPLSALPDSSTTLLLAEGLTFQLLFSEKDTVFNFKGEKGLAKGNHDFNAFIQQGNDSALLFVGHETNAASDQLGDGGAATLLSLKKSNAHWTTYGHKQAFDFSPVGGTAKNCSGFLTNKGTILSAEEFPPENNLELYHHGKGFRDTSNYNGLKRYQSMGWIVEIDLATKKAVSKIQAMGRFSHEAALVMPDGKTVYLTDDFTPSVFFKFIAKEKHNFSEGQLYAYQQSSNGKTGSWIPLPMQLDSLLIIRDVAIRSGATLFTRMEWLTLVNGKIYLTETGADEFTLHKEIEAGGKPCYHLSTYQTTNGYDYPYGSVLEFDPKKNSMNVFLKGGKGIQHPTKHFSNPDGITHLKINKHSYLIINEDLIANDKERSPFGKTINEVWCIDVSLKKPTVDDLHRLLIAPEGAETTGGCFTPDGQTYFLNIQHPDKNNPAPFNKSCTIAISGFGNFRKP